MRQTSVSVFSYPARTDEDLFVKVLKHTRRREGRVDVVIDTDTYNEIDDQYAIAYLLASQEQVNIQGIFAAPFLNHHSAGTEEGMEKSYGEILRVLDMTGYSHLNPKVFRGARDFLPDEETPVDSPAARELVRLAMEHTPEDPLYVICICAPVNVASAILAEPEITNRMVVVWSGGVGLSWPDCRCFNGGQNVAASRVLLESNVPLVLTPGRGVADRLSSTGPELEYWLRGKNSFCDYILDRTIEEAELFRKGNVWSRPLTDVVPAAWVVNENFMLDRFEPRPTIEYDLYYSFDPRRPMMRYVYGVKRDELMDDLFKKLSGLS